MDMTFFFWKLQHHRESLKSSRTTEIIAVFLGFKCSRAIEMSLQLRMPKEDFLFARLDAETLDLRLVLPPSPQAD